MDLTDFNILATRFGAVLDAPTARGNGGELALAPFSKLRIGDVAKSRHSHGLVTKLNDMFS